MIDLAETLDGYFYMAGFINSLFDVLHIACRYGMGADGTDMNRDRSWVAFFFWRWLNALATHVDVTGWGSAGYLCIISVFYCRLSAETPVRFWKRCGWSRWR